MATEPESQSRNQDRHSHISIRLQYLTNERWEHLEALNWNAKGFSFYHAQTLDQPQLQLKRGLTHFEGTLMWSAVSSDDAVVLGALVNELIFKRAGDVIDDPALRSRLLKLIRVPGMVEQKRQILASLGLDIPEARMAQLIAKRKQERPLVHYGVKVQSASWATVVENALSMSAAVVSLEQWSKALQKR